MYTWYRETVPFTNGLQTPMPDKDGEKPTVARLLGVPGPAAKRVVSKLPKDILEQLKESIETPGSYYAFGDFRNTELLIVCPKQKRLYRIRNA